MSHTTTVEVELKDLEVLKEVLEELGLEYTEGEIKLFSTVHEGIGFKLPGWKYPVVIDREGKLHYDNWEGRWGTEEILWQYLKRIKNEYAKKLVERKVRKLGGRVLSVRRSEDEIVLEVEL